MKANLKTINLQWIENEEKYEKDISREDIINIMQSLKNGFDENNEISKKMCEVLPKTVSILIDKDRNEQVDIPTIAVKYEKDNDKHMIGIRRCHKIIWGIFNEYCKL
ncbi:MAG: hypothetical protein HFJ40_04505 [Clostridia bacterium]|nr:hypothetical protein [Clostridia bacterium]